MTYLDPFVSALRNASATQSSKQGIISKAFGDLGSLEKLFGFF
jgi:hypothetical protein